MPKQVESALIPVKARSGMANSTADRAIDVLLLFSEEKPVWTAAEIAAHFAMPRSTTYRYLHSLSAYALIAEDGRGQYRLGQRIFPLARAAKAGASIQTLTLPLMEELNRKHGEVVILYERVGEDVIELGRIECLHRVRISYHRVQMLPWPAPASAKVLLAYAPAAEQSRLLGMMHPAQYTPKTVGTEKGLQLAMKKIRTEGYAYSDQELELGIRAISVPIFTTTGSRHCLAMSGPLFRLTDEKIGDMIADVKAAAAAISDLLTSTDY